MRLLVLCGWALWRFSTPWIPTLYLMRIEQMFPSHSESRVPLHFSPSWFSFSMQSLFVLFECLWFIFYFLCQWASLTFQIPKQFCLCFPLINFKDSGLILIYPELTFVYEMQWVWDRNRDMCVCVCVHLIFTALFVEQTFLDPLNAPSVGFLKFEQCTVVLYDVNISICTDLN